MVRETETRWIKLAVELGVDTTYNFVSVITDNWSDDANGEIIPSNKCWLRITRKGDFLGLHYSVNGDRWRFVRCFGLDLPVTVKVGFGIQAPLGDKCEGKLDFITLTVDSVKTLEMAVNAFLTGLKIICKKCDLYKVILTNSRINSC